jgi:uncharacterized membrane protein SpoIIM required for sporulation
MAVFSFGIGMLLLLMVPVSLVSFLTTQLLQAGINPMLVFATVIPHSLLEVPAALLAGALALRLGACIIRPPEGKSVGDEWMKSLATATRLWWTLILPLLMLGAIVEVTVTPSLVRLLAGS